MTQVSNKPFGEVQARYNPKSTTGSSDAPRLLNAKSPEHSHSTPAMRAEAEDTLLSRMSIIEHDRAMRDSKPSPTGKVTSPSGPVEWDIQPTPRMKEWDISPTLSPTLAPRHPWDIGAATPHTNLSLMDVSMPSTAQPSSFTGPEVYYERTRDGRIDFDVPRSLTEAPHTAWKSRQMRNSNENSPPEVAARYLTSQELERQRAMALASSDIRSYIALAQMPFWNEEMPSTTTPTDNGIGIQLVDADEDNDSDASADSNCGWGNHVEDFKSMVSEIYDSWSNGGGQLTVEKPMKFKR